MTKLKKLLVIGLAILSISAVSVTAFAASEYKSPAEVYSAVTKTSLDDALTLRQTSGMSFGKLAQEAFVSEEFKTQVFEMKKEILLAKVEAGEITQVKADEILAVIESHLTDCDGTGFTGVKAGVGIGFGTGTMLKQGNNTARNSLSSMQRGGNQRQNLRNSSCLGD